MNPFRVERNKEKTYRRKARLKISFQITAIVLVILTIVELAALMSFRSSLDQLTKNSKEKVIEAVAGMISSSHGYVSGLMLDIQAKEAIPMNSSEFFQQVKGAIKDESVTPTQELGDELLSSMVEEGMLGLDVMYYALPPNMESNSEPVVVVSSNGKYMYSKVPDEVADLARKNMDFKLFEHGIPDMGLSGAYLVDTHKLESDSPAGVLWFFDFKPMGDLVSGIDAFFDKEKRKVYLSLLIVMSLAILGLFIISFLILGYLVNKRITRPVDELLDAAEKVIEGDLNPRVEIRRGEEFSALKRAFNMMVSRHARIIAQLVGQTPTEKISDQIREQGEVGEYSRKSGQRSKFLLQITALFAALFIIAGSLSVVMTGRSINNLVKNSKNKLVETDAQLISSSHAFMAELLIRMYDPTGALSQEIIGYYDKVINRDPEAIPFLMELSETLRKMIDYGFFGLTLVYAVFPPMPGITESSFIFASSDDEYILEEPAEEILEMIDKGVDSWKLFENGISGMGLDEGYLVTTYVVSTPGSPLRTWSIDFKPMSEEIKSINSFFQDEKSKLNLVIGLTVGISVLVTILIVYFALSYLLRKKITEPVDELTAAAEDVIKGNLNVEVKVRSGEELENLKRIFNRMVKSLRDLVAKSLVD
ncbi:MAG: HAMP domain-containing protein [Actinobacteria bacterium]|nr:HAMP domain-containing protein [Actinomycetota bacterium]